jgi:hypothetical protein
MSLAFEAIYPEVYPIAYDFFENGIERHWVAGKVFGQLGKRFNVPKNELNTAAIDLSISCAENDFKNKLEKGTSGRLEDDKIVARLLRLNKEE